MLFIADIPPVTEVQEIRYEYLLEEKVFLSQGFQTSQERTGLLFLKQANRLVELSGNTEFTKAKENYERLALLNFQAYLERLGE